ncbi:protein SOB FIVE-LIKE 1-like [Salvia miltiorrhiza]|uniref:protein SOB FIVE-LIKE 1-like n=1 Tax=Salvia miltiorrhiza TaxID=226208 RepID=UPI0025AC1A13|nr:protein SOB FIVE-LIKE 1-like [Salvia miltiorrhiza]
MDPPKIGSEECSSSESGWTTYIASPDLEHDYADHNEDEDDEDDATIARKGLKKVEQQEAAADSDDSMASDASSGPSDQYGYLGRSHHAGTNNQRNSAAKKHQGKKKQIKQEKDKSPNTAGRLKKF